MEKRQVEICVQNARTLEVYMRVITDVKFSSRIVSSLMETFGDVCVITIEPYNK